MFYRAQCQFPIPRTDVATKRIFTDVIYHFTSGANGPLLRRWYVSMIWTNGQHKFAPSGCENSISIKTPHTYTRVAIVLTWDPSSQVPSSTTESTRPRPPWRPVRCDSWHLKLHCSAHLTPISRRRVEERPPQQVPPIDTYATSMIIERIARDYQGQSMSI